jgi:four helix bundle protein
MDKPYNIRERARLFADQVFEFCRELRAKGPLYDEIVQQLNDAAGSIGSNLAEAKDGESKKDFIHKNSIALKEANESNYWLKRAWKAEKPLRKKAEPLIQESRELISIITAIIVKAKSNPDRGPNAG